MGRITLPSITGGESDVGHLARAWRGIYITSMVLVVWFNAFVAVTQAFLKIGFLHALAPTGKEPPFAIAQLLVLVAFVVIGVTAFRRYRARTASAMISPAASGT